MKKITGYIRNYIQQADQKVFISVSIACAVLVFINYYFHLHTRIEKNSFFPFKLFTWFGVFIVAFGIPLLLQRINRPAHPPLPAAFYILFFLAPLVFALKYTLHFQFKIVDGYAMNSYWNKILYWPLLLLIITGILFAIRKWISREETVYGILSPVPDLKPYLFLLLLMIPLISLASVQPDFQAMYPKLKTLAGAGTFNNIPGWQVLLFEVSYGTDFFTIELFFRGFLVLVFSKWLGKDAILPAAVFYCSIHFGKPLGECISSYFGGIILGIIVYNTRSVWGGLLAHLGIAWMMEASGYLVSSF